MLRDYPFFWPALRNTLWFVVVIVTLRIVVGLVLGMTRDQGQAGQRGCSARSSTRRTSHRRWPGTLAFVFLLNPGTGPVNSILGKLGLPEPGWFNDPSWSKPALTLLALWGDRRPDGHLHGVAARRTARAVRGGRARRRRRRTDGSGTSRSRTCGRSSAFAVVTGIIAMMQYYTEPLVAGQVASGQIGGSGQQDEPGYPGGSTLTLPQLVYNLGFQRFDFGAACVVALVLFAMSMVFAAFLMRPGGGLVARED